MEVWSWWILCGCLGFIGGCLLLFLLVQPTIKCPDTFFSKWFYVIFAFAASIAVAVWLTFAIHSFLPGLFAEKDDSRYYSTRPAKSSSSKSDDYDWDDYDYDRDGEINQYEWEDALGDKLKEYGY